MFFAATAFLLKIEMYKNSLTISADVVHGDSGV